MTFTWAEYHQLCEALLKATPSGLEEATFRCVCSRAYYAAFGSARDIAQRVDKLSMTGLGDDHGIVIRHSKNHSDNNRYKIGLRLRQLKDNRTLADYDARMPVTRKLAESSVSDARFVLETLAKLTP